MVSVESWQDLKARGNLLFKDGKYELSVECYAKALQGLSLAPAADNATAMMVAVLGNKSLVHMKLHQYGEACQAAIQLLKLDPLCVKGYFRLASTLAACQAWGLTREVGALGKRLARCVARTPHLPAKDSCIGLTLNHGSQRLGGTLNSSSRRADWSVRPAEGPM